jgi:hypothetical protein
MPPQCPAQGFIFQNNSEDFRASSGLSAPAPGMVDLEAARLRGRPLMRRKPVMIGTSAPQAAEKRTALSAIAVGGLLAGTLDLLHACILFGWDIPLAIAGGLLGKQAFQGGAAIYTLGVLLHFFIAGSAAATYFFASRVLPFLKQYPLVCGLFFGAAVEDFMRFVVLPLSAFHSHGPYQYNDLVRGLAVHMVVVGLPIAYSVKRFAK